MFINIGMAYINTDDIKMINAVEQGTEEDKKFGITVLTRTGNYKCMCEGRSARNELLQRILEQTNAPDAQLTEIRKQLVNINTRITRIEKKQTEIQKSLKRIEEALQH